ncbi:CAP domain-containing protein, partial [Massilia arenosa]
APPLTPEAALARADIGSGMFPDQVLERAGFPVERADVISISGPQDAKTAMAAIQARHCATLLSTGYTAIGASRTGAQWQIVLALPERPTFARTLPDWHEAGRTILAAVNEARAQTRMCGDREYPATGPVTWNETLGEAALRHSRDMATRRFFNHRGSDGTLAPQRATQEGYAWHRIGENIASGQGTPEEAVAGWIASPGHCANLMNPGFSEMGAAYAANPTRHVLYWTQVFASPR